MKREETQSEATLVQTNETKLKGFRRIAWGAFIVVTLLAAWLAYDYSSENQRVYLNDLKIRAESSMQARVARLAAWQKDISQRVGRLIDSEMFRLYAADVDALDGDISRLVMRDSTDAAAANEEVSYLKDQLPLMENTLRNFIFLNGFTAGRIINRSGQAYISTDGAVNPLSASQREQVKTALDTGKSVYSPLRPGGEVGILLDLCVPVMPVDGAGNRPVAVLLVSVPASKAVGEALARSPMSVEGDRARLVQKNGSIYQEVLTSGVFPDITEQRFQLAPDGSLPFDLRSSLVGEDHAYSLGGKVPGMDWWILQEADYQTNRTNLLSVWFLAFSLALLAALTVGLLGFAIWWNRVSKFNQEVAVQFQTLAVQAEGQRQLLDGINASVLDFICLKSVEGEYTYVNTAMASAFGAEPAKMVGKTDQDLFGYGTAKRLEVSDQQVLQGAQAAITKETLYLSGQRRDFQVSKVPHLTSSGKITGIVAVYRDITEMVAAQQRQIKAMEGIVDALVMAVEMMDPYLAGHSYRVGAFSEAMATIMGLSDDVKTTVKLAANLSQLGKLFVDRALVEKEGIMTEEERRAIRQHVEYAGRIVKNIDFNLPIYDALYQMNERPDGSGYPQGLMADDISLEARILSVANVFCAMIRPRAYRGGMSVDRALDTLRANPGQNDQEAVEALARVLELPVGEKILATLGAALPKK